jgi:NAD(P)-dependent dehydrogenase (short-subunit alcohol dehydrogenase family)
MTVMPELDGKVVVITGAAGRIGSVTSRVLAEAGARVMLADLASQPVDGVCESIAADGHDVAWCAVDISDEGSVKALVQATVDTFGGIDVLDNNAAALGRATAGTDTDVTSMDMEVWDRIFAVNLRGPMLLCKHVIPVMVGRGGGSIVNISSGMSLAGDVIFFAYGCTKGAINVMTRYIATAYGDQGIRCNAILPGVIVGDGEDTSSPFTQIYKANKLVGRLGHPRDIANAVVFLASDRSSFITGQLLSVDGGFSAHQPSTIPFKELMAAGTPPRNP